VEDKWCGLMAHSTQARIPTNVAHVDVTGIHLFCAPVNILLIGKHAWIPRPYIQFVWEMMLKKLLVTT
jgi:hypothetical protein